MKNLDFRSTNTLKFSAEEKGSFEDVYDQVYQSVYDKEYQRHMKRYRDIQEDSNYQSPFYTLAELESFLQNITYEELPEYVREYFEGKFQSIFEQFPEAETYVKSIRIDFKGGGPKYQIAEYVKGENRIEWYKGMERWNVPNITRDHPQEEIRKYFIDKYMNRTIVHELVHSLQYVMEGRHPDVAPYPDEEHPEYRNFGKVYNEDPGEIQAHEVGNDFTYPRKAPFIGKSYSGLKFSSPGDERFDVDKLLFTQNYQEGKSGGEIFWGSKKEQEKRFEALLQLGDFTDCSILDVGCGFGDFLDFLQVRGIVPKNYVGIDVLPEVIDVARKNHPEGAFFVSSLEEVDKKFDYVIGSGIFCTKDVSWDAVVKTTLHQMYFLCLKGVGVNFNVGPASSEVLVTTSREQVKSLLAEEYSDYEFSECEEDLVLFLFKEQKVLSSLQFSTNLKFSAVKPLLGILNQLLSEGPQTAEELGAESILKNLEQEGYIYPINGGEYVDITKRGKDFAEGSIRKQISYPERAVDYKKFEKVFSTYWEHYKVRHPYHTGVFAKIDAAEEDKEQFVTMVWQVYKGIVNTNKKENYFAAEKNYTEIEARSIEHAIQVSLERLELHGADVGYDMIRHTPDLINTQRFINRDLNSYVGALRDVLFFSAPVGVVLSKEEVLKRIKGFLQNKKVLQGKVKINVTQITASLYEQLLQFSNSSLEAIAFFEDTNVQQIVVRMKEILMSSPAANIPFRNFRETYKIRKNSSTSVLDDIFKGINLSGKDCSELNLSNMVITEGKFIDTHFEGASFDGSTITKNDFSSAHFDDAAFAVTTFSGNTIVDTDFRGVNVGVNLLKSNKGRPKNLLISQIEYQEEEIPNIKKNLTQVTGYASGVPVIGHEEDAKVVGKALQELLRSKFTFSTLKFASALTSEQIAQLKRWDETKVLPTFVSPPELFTWLKQQSKSGELAKIFPSGTIKWFMGEAKKLEVKNLSDPIRPVLPNNEIAKVEEFVNAYRGKQVIPTDALLDLMEDKSCPLAMWIKAYGSTIDLKTAKGLLENIVFSLHGGMQNSAVRPRRNYNVFPFVADVLPSIAEKVKGPDGRMLINVQPYGEDKTMFGLALYADLKGFPKRLRDITHAIVDSTSSHKAGHVVGSLCYATITPTHKMVIDTNSDKVEDKKVWVIGEMQSDPYQKANWEGVSLEAEKVGGKNAVEDFRAVFQHWPLNLMNEIIRCALAMDIDEIWMPQHFIIAGMTEQSWTAARAQEDKEIKKGELDPGDRKVVDRSSYYDRAAEVFGGKLTDVGKKFNPNRDTRRRAIETSQYYVIKIPKSVVSSLKFGLNSFSAVKNRNKLSWKLPFPKEFTDVLDSKKYSYHIDNGTLTIDHKGYVYLYSLTTLPNNVQFNNEGFVNLSNLTTLPNNIQFNNEGNVYLSSLPTLPDNKEQIFKNYRYKIWYNRENGSWVVPARRQAGLLVFSQLSTISLVSHPDYYNYTSGNSVWQMNLYDKAKAELQQEGELEGINHVEPEHVTKEDVALVHTPKYVEDIFGHPKISQFARSAWSGGPWNETAQKAVTRSTGGMIKANEEALNNGVAIQLYDAFHHAYPGYGEGFCVINDIAVAAKKSGKRVMVVDTDVHQGQGTAVCCAGDNNIYTLSTHEKYNYPSPKEKSSLDVEFKDGITDEEYLSLLKNGLDRAISEFGKPDLVMYVAGTDLYRGDRLSNTRVTLEGIQKRDQMVFDFFGQMGVPISVSIPQGYANNSEDSIAMIKNTIKAAKQAHELYYKRAKQPVASLKFGLDLSREVKPARLSWKISFPKEFTDLLDSKKYSYHIANGTLIIDHEGYVNLSNLTTLPNNVQFNNRGYVYLLSLTTLPNNIQFNNKGFVHLNNLTTLPNNVQFNNKGFVHLNNLTTLPDNKEQIFKNYGYKVWYNGANSTWTVPNRVEGTIVASLKFSDVYSDAALDIAVNYIKAYVEEEKLAHPDMPAEEITRDAYRMFETLQYPEGVNSEWFSGNMPPAMFQKFKQDVSSFMTNDFKEKINTDEFRQDLRQHLIDGGFGDIFGTGPARHTEDEVLRNVLRTDNPEGGELVGPEGEPFEEEQGETGWKQQEEEEEIELPSYMMELTKRDKQNLIDKYLDELTRAKAEGETSRIQNLETVLRRLTTSSLRFILDR